MIRGKDTPFVPGKTFKFLVDLSPEERKRNQNSTRKCEGCGKQKKKDHFLGYGGICFECAEDDY